MSPRLARLGRRYAAWRVGRDLDGLHVAGLAPLRVAAERGPVLIVANHVAWWDGMLALALGHALGLEVGLVAREEALRAHPWMGALGVFPLRTGLRVRASLRAAGAFLDRPRRVLWFFPQGRQRPEGIHPLGFQAGLAPFARMLDAQVLPVSLGYPFREVEVPAAALVVHPGGALDGIEATVAEGRGMITRWADGEPLPFEAVLPSRRRPQQARLGARLLTGVLA